MASFAHVARQRNHVDFAEINRVALIHLPSLIRVWLPDGRRHGGEWIALNPTRGDKHPGSFSVNLRSGKWGDFALGHKGGDVISLAAYIFRCRQIEAARVLATTLGVRL